MKEITLTDGTKIEFDTLGMSLSQIEHGEYKRIYIEPFSTIELIEFLYFQRKEL